MTTRASSTRLPRDERREQLVVLGRELLGTRPYEQVSIGELARAAGVSKGLLYHYFPTKSDFVVAVLEQSHAELAEQMTPDPALPAEQRLDAAIDAVLRYAEEHRQGFLATMRARHGPDETIREVLAAARARRVSSLVELAARRAGAPREEVESPLLQAAAEGWVHLSEHVIGRWLERGDLERDAVLALLRDTLLGALDAGLAARGSPAPVR